MDKLKALMSGVIYLQDEMMVEMRFTLEHTLTQALDEQQTSLTEYDF